MGGLAAHAQGLTQAQRLLVRGIVQGVGFRPFVYSLAQRYRLTGWVRNTTAGVEIHWQGSGEQLEQALEAIVREKPPLAVISKLIREPAEPGDYASFSILASVSQPGTYQAIPTDTATCPDCLRELFDAADRRYRYPFTNCTNCGPRFTIITDLPYDRPHTTMQEFVMCPDCRREYDDPINRRFHAQPNACPVCGPQLHLYNTQRQLLTEVDEALQQAAQALANGQIVALKGLGGYQLACDATNQAAVQTLRQRKRRPDKPFALMVGSLPATEALVELNAQERELLVAPSAPIVLSRRRASTVAEAVAPGIDTLGVMLPSTPLHHLLLDACARPLVMTSGNLSEEPLAAENDEAFERLAGIADLFLTHNRRINTRLDDSIVQAGAGQPQVIRRARGLAPDPITLPREGPAVLAYGPEFKNTLCLARGRMAFISQHLGDMQSLETWQFFEEAAALYQHLFRTTPEALACDLHPDYMITRHALAQSQLPVIQVQHHHAHLASCLADNGLDEPAIGVIMDGTGYGLDSRIWGGEFLVGNAEGFVRAGHLQYLPLPGGEGSIRNPVRTALAYWQTLLPGHDLPPSLATVPVVERQMVRSMVEHSIQTLMTSSAGRLFDAASAILGICPRASYEAQAAAELEALANRKPIAKTPTSSVNGRAQVPIAAGTAGPTRNDPPGTRRTNAR